MSKEKLHPETLALSAGYDPDLSQGAVKPPAFLTSTFEFASAEAGKRFFEIAYGKVPAQEGEDPGLIYSRINNPNLQIFEERMAIWDQNEKGAVFSSGMAAISSSLLAHLKPGDVLISTSPIYGGTHTLFHKVFPKFGIRVLQVSLSDHTHEEMRKKVLEVGVEKVKVFYVETPANPSNYLIDISAVAGLARELQVSSGQKIITMVDNTLLGPLFQTPSELGADLTVYSATKFIGGHSDLIAGVVTGTRELIDPIRSYRTYLGGSPSAFDSWLLLRSLETLAVRMRRQMQTAQKVASYLAEHASVSQVLYPSLLAPGSRQAEIFAKQCKGTGALISFEVKGGEAKAFEVLNRFQVCRLAVSLGGTETLVQHPMTMTHSDVPKEELARIGVSAGLIRISVGLEHEDDLIADLKQALG